MEATEIEVNGVYAYLKQGSTRGPHEPLSARVLEAPSGGQVKVLLKHPDTGDSEELVATRELVGNWFDEPDERFAQHHSAIAASHGRGQVYTWADVARIRYELIARQRALAARVNAMGVPKAPANYAGAGGRASDAITVSLTLNYDELETLLARAERVPA